MPLTKKGEKIKSAMEREYGSKKGEAVFYASRNAGKINGVDRKVNISKDAKGHIHVFLPGGQYGRKPVDVEGLVRTLSRGSRTIKVDVPKKPRDMRRSDFEELKALLAKFFNEEEQELEHQTDNKGCDCGSVNR